MDEVQPRIGNYHEHLAAHNFVACGFWNLRDLDKDRKTVSEKRKAENLLDQKRSAFT